MKLIRLLILTILATITQLAYADIEPTSGRYVEVNTDLAVKVVGGHITWVRRYRDRQWRFNKEWESLLLTYDATTGNVESIRRADDIYRKLDSAGVVFKFGKRRTIRKQADGTWLWRDRNGNSTKYDANGKTLSVQTQTGAKISFAYNGDNKLSTVNDVNGVQILWIEYDLVTGQVSKTRDYGNREVNYTWQTVNATASPVRYKLINIKDARGYDWKYTYSGATARDGRVDVISRIDPENRVAIIAYSGSGRTKGITNALGHTANYQFDYIKPRKEFYLKSSFPGGRVVETWYERDGEQKRTDINGMTVRTITEDLRKDIMTDTFGKVTVREYDEFENEVKKIYPDGSTQEFSYDLSNTNILLKKDQNNIETKYSYDQNGNLIQVQEAFATNVERAITLTYDQFGQVLTVTRQGDATTSTSQEQFFYDSFGNTSRYINGNGIEETYTYDSQGNMLTFTDGRQKLWQFKYDELGHLLEYKTPNQFITRYNYNKAGLLIEKTFADSSTNLYTYDAVNRPKSFINELGGEVKLEYSLAGKVIRSIGTDNKITNYTYDLLGRLTKRTMPDGWFVEFIYPQVNSTQNGLGDFYNPIEARYPTLNITMKYDLQNRLVEENKTYLQNGQNFVDKVINQYDAVGNLLAKTGANVRDETFEYDPFNRVLKRSVNNILQNQYTYDNRNNLLSFFNANNNEYKYEFDLANNKTKIIRPMGQVETYSFDDNNNLVFKINAKGEKTAFDYDDDNRNIVAKYFDVSQQLAKTTQFILNSRGSLIHYDDGVSTGDFTVNNRQQRLSETIAINNKMFSHSYSYYNNGKKKSFTGVDGINYQFFYNENLKLENIVIPNEGNISFSNFIWDQPQVVNYPGGTTKNISYDGIQRISSIDVKDVNGSQIQKLDYLFNQYGFISSKQTMQGLNQYQYDDFDRVVDASYPTLTNEQWQYDQIGNRIMDAKTAATAWQYNQNNQLQDAVNYKFDYDANGNITQKKDENSVPINSYVYDETTRLKYLQDENDNNIFEYYYDPFGKRVFKKNLANNETTYFHYSDEGLTYELHADGTEINYLFMPSESITEPVLKKTNNQYFYYLNDHLGTPHKIIDNEGIVHHAKEYSAFGEFNSYISLNNHTDNILFPGQYFDTETLTNYNFHRNYDPQFGRYLQRDPLGILADANEYIYVDNGPIDYTDPYGLAKAGGKICFGIGCGSIKLDISFTCITATVCLSIEIGFKAGGGKKKKKPQKPKKSGSASIGALTDKGHYKFKKPTTPPNPEHTENGQKPCFSWEAGCSINVFGFEDGFSYGSGGGEFSTQIDPTFKPGLGAECTVEVCVQVYSSCAKCDFNGCGSY